MKLYERYKVDEILGLVSRPGSVKLVRSNDINGPINLALCPALESVYMWNLNTAELKHIYKDDDSTGIEVKCINVSPEEDRFSAGYSDGTIRIWSIHEPDTPCIMFKGNTSAITSIEFGRKSKIMAASSMDTIITVWDLTTERGLYKLKGHTNQVTGLKFLENDGLFHLVSIGKDSLIKIWDLAARDCVETIINPSGEIVSLEVGNNDLILTASGSNVTFWKIDYQSVKKLSVSNFVHGEQATIADKDWRYDGHISLGKALGTIERYNSGPITRVKYSECYNYIFISGKDNKIDVFAKLSNKQINKKKKNLLKRKRDEKSHDGVPVEQVENQTITLSAPEMVRRICTITLDAKVNSFDIMKNPKAMDEPYMLVNLAMNQISLLVLKLRNNGTPDDLYNEVSLINVPGHRYPPKWVCISDNDEYIATCSEKEIKIWNIEYKQCIKSVDVNKATVCEFIGNRYVIIGTADGSLLLFDTNSSDITHYHNAHTTYISSIQSIADTKLLITSSRNGVIKFWEFPMLGTSEPILKRTFNTESEITYVMISPNGKLMCVAFNDFSVKIFYTDTFNLFLTLYGHKLPVTSIDISSDTSIIATTSIDKTIKLWGLDFGDCRKSFLAHESVVTRCMFEQGTHNLFSVGRDGKLVYIDAEKLEIISKSTFHHGDIWGFAVAKRKDFLVTVSNDMSVRIIRKSDDMFTMQEERQAELDRLYMAEIKNARRAFSGLLGEGAENADYKQTNDDTRDAELMVKDDIDVVPEGNEILELLDVYEIDRAIMDEYYELLKTNRNTPMLPRDPFIMAMGDPLIPPELYVLKKIEKIKSSILENALIMLPYNKIVNLLTCIEFWSKENRSILLVTRILLNLIRLNHYQLSTDSSFSKVLADIKTNISEKLESIKDTVGENVSVIKTLERKYGANITITSYPS